LGVARALSAIGAAVIVQLAAAPAPALAGPAAAACDLKVRSAWIREATPGASALAAYGIFENTGAKPLRITKIETAAAAMAMIHETLVENGVAEMRMVSDLDLAAGGKLKLAPGGKHLMLSGLKSLPKVGDQIIIEFTDAAGCVTSAPFKVRPLLSPP
jgi:copper(I)-binding protein